MIGAVLYSNEVEIVFLDICTLLYYLYFCLLLLLLRYILQRKLILLLRYISHETFVTRYKIKSSLEKKNHGSDETVVEHRLQANGESVILAHVNALLTVRKSPILLVTVSTSFELVHALYCLSVSMILFGVISPRYPVDQGKMHCNMQWKDVYNNRSKSIQVSINK